ncbi:MULTISPECIES: DUF983 domain-containing protein [Bizionia]|uniref:DUF983 domain-containing protein n=1 Tax=Bizionia algoritergicola TaxID=291187 RepID=A0A5D0QV92_9FLAO|nr:MULTISPECIES: DUF983 domain-containing protein [Bizionia]OBX22115.1 DUF983 domain-containing protein [Bizionia sp. APA-3]TYB72338.1 DUF983 domain-containing protein [Bizionia algoritergicola]
MKKGTKLYSVLKLKCPRCQIGNLFHNPGLFVFSGILDMPNACEHCKQDFKLEPGFYTAALWISYPIVLVVFIPLILLGFSLDTIHGFFKFLYPLVIVFSFILQIPLMRVARAVLLNMTIDYTTKW